jgi:2-oxoglutarate dehydrogenase E2 component (dihydrolipoamide succinyltransferase)
MSFFTKAGNQSIKIIPDVNSMMDGDHKIADFFFGIFQLQFQTKGLMVPVFVMLRT